MEYAVIAFANTHTAILTQKHLKGIIPFSVMPTPRAISEGCGISLRIAPEDMDKAKEVLAEKGIAEEMFEFHLL